jgi:hypothetical protein
MDTREQLIAEVAQLKAERPPGWDRAVSALCDKLGDIEGLPRAVRAGNGHQAKLPTVGNSGNGHHLVDGDSVGFDDDRNPIPLSWPTYQEPEQEPEDSGAMRREVVIRLLDFVAETGSPDEVGRRAILLRHLMRPGSGQEELASRLGLSQATISRRCISLTKEFAGKMGSE